MLSLLIIYRFVPPWYQAVTSSTREYTTQAVWFQFGKRDNSEDKKHDSKVMSPGEILAAILAALTLLVATIPLFRCPRFRHWVSSFISPVVKVYLPLFVLPIHIHIHILNPTVLHRKLSALSFQTLCRLAQRIQAPYQLLYLTLSTLTMTILIPTLLVPVLEPSCAAEMALAGSVVGYSQ